MNSLISAAYSKAKIDQTTKTRFSSEEVLTVFNGLSSSSSFSPLSPPPPSPPLPLSSKAVVLTAVNPTIVYDSSRPTLKKKETKVTRTVPSRPLLVWTLAAVKQDDSTLHPQKEQLQAELKKISQDLDTKFNTLFLRDKCQRTIHKQSFQDQMQTKVELGLVERQAYQHFVESQRLCFNQHSRKIDQLQQSFVQGHFHDLQKKRQQEEIESKRKHEQQEKEKRQAREAETRRRQEEKEQEAIREQEAKKKKQQQEDEEQKQRKPSLERKTTQPEKKENKKLTPPAVQESQNRLEKLRRVQQMAALVNSSHSSFADKLLELQVEQKCTIQKISATKMSCTREANVLLSNFREAKKISPELYSFVLADCCNTFMRQCETKIRLHLASAFPLGMVLTHLCIAEPDLLDVLLGSFHQHCVFTIPILVERQNFRSQEDFLVALGYSQDSSTQNGLQTEEAYFEKLTGFIALWSAILQYNIARHPFGIDKGWTWLARFVNLPPHPATATCLLTFLEIAGHALLSAYPRQTKKILHLIEETIMPQLDKHSTPPRVASYKRLELFFEEYKKNGFLKVYEGSVLPEKQESFQQRIVIRSGDEYQT